MWRRSCLVTCRRWGSQARLWEAPKVGEGTYLAFSEKMEEAQKHGHVLLAADIIRQMSQSESLEPSRQLYGVLLRTSIEGRSHEHIQQAWKLMESRGYLSNTEYRLVIAHYFREGAAVLALQHWEKMKAASIRTDEAMYRVLVDGVSSSGMLQSTIRLGEEMLQLGENHCMCVAELVSSFIRLHQFKRAIDLLRSLPDDNEGRRLRIGLWKKIRAAPAFSFHSEQVKEWEDRFG
jgi:hypothetical protein